MQILIPCFVDFIDCLSKQFMAHGNGIVSRSLKPLIVNLLTYCIPDIDASLSIRHHLAFAPYTSMKTGSTFDNEFIQEAVFEKLTHLEELVKTLTR